MWRSIVRRWYTTAHNAGGILGLALMLLLVPTAALIYIVEAYRCGVQFFVACMVARLRTGAGMDEDGRS